MSALLHSPLPAAVWVVPWELAPSKSSTVLPGSAVPEMVTLPSLMLVPSGGLVMSGAAGSCGVYRPGVTIWSIVGVAGGVRGPHGEGVGSIGESGVDLGGGTGTEVATIELALEGSVRFVGRELEGGRSAVRQGGRL